MKGLRLEIIWVLFVCVIIVSSCDSNGSMGRIGQWFRSPLSTCTIMDMIWVVCLGSLLAGAIRSLFGK